MVMARSVIEVGEVGMVVVVKKKEKKERLVIITCGKRNGEIMRDCQSSKKSATSSRFLFNPRGHYS